MDDEDLLDPRRVTLVLAVVAAGDMAGLAAYLSRMHAANMADLQEQIAPGERRALLALGAAEIDGEVPSELDEAIRKEGIAVLPHKAVAEATRALDTEDVVDIPEDLDPPQLGMILKALDDVDRVAVEPALSDPVYSAGHLMLRDILEDRFRTIEATRPEGDVADRFNQYHLISCPVVVDGRSLVAVIPIDDAMAVLDAEPGADRPRLATMMLS